METKVNSSGSNVQQINGLTLSLANNWSDNPFLRTPSLSDLPFQDMMQSPLPSLQLQQQLSTPTTQLLFPKFVTEEQKEFADGFVAALEMHHRRESPIGNRGSPIGNRGSPIGNRGSPIVNRGSPFQAGDNSSSGSSVSNDYSPKHTTILNSASQANQHQINETFYPTSSTFLHQASSSQPIIPTSDMMHFSNRTWNQSIPVTKPNHVNASSGDNKISTLPLTVHNQNFSTASTVLASNHSSFQTQTTASTLSFDTYKLGKFETPDDKDFIHSMESECVPNHQYIPSKELYGNFEPTPNSMSWNNLRCSSASPSSVGTSDMDDQERIKLERKRAKNREAAQRCQQRKVERISRLENKVEHLREQNSSLNQTVVALRMEISRLQHQIISHTNRGCHLMLPNSNIAGNMIQANIR